MGHIKWCPLYMYCVLSLWVQNVICCVKIPFKTRAQNSRINTKIFHTSTMISHSSREVHEQVCWAPVMHTSSPLAVREMRDLLTRSGPVRPFKWLSQFPVPCWLWYNRLSLYSVRNLSPVPFIFRKFVQYGFCFHFCQYIFIPVMILANALPVSSHESHFSSCN